MTLRHVYAFSPSIFDRPVRVPHNGLGWFMPIEVEAWELGWSANLEPSDDRLTIEARCDIADKLRRQR